MASIYIETFGCQMNEADSQYIADRAASAGYAVAERPEDANIVVLNTCTVRDNAERRAYGRMNHFKVLKQADPSVKLVVMGCLAEQDRDRMRASCRIWTPCSARRNWCKWAMRWRNGARSLKTPI